MILLRVLFWIAMYMIPIVFSAIILTPYLKARRKWGDEAVFLVNLCSTMWPMTVPFAVPITIIYWAIYKPLMYLHEKSLAWLTPKSQNIEEPKVNESKSTYRSIVLDPVSLLDAMKPAPKKPNVFKRTLNRFYKPKDK